MSKAKTLDNNSGQKIRCGDCFSWNTKDCERFLPQYPNMPIWEKSIPCDKFVPSDTSSTKINGEEAE